MQMVFLLAYIYYEDRPGLKVDKEHLKKQDLFAMMHYGLMLALGAITFTGLKNIDAIMLAHYVNLKIVGIFAIAAMVPYVN